MDFFEHQSRARQRTRRLVGLFAVAVAALVVLIYLAARLVLLGSEGRPEGSPGLWDGALFGVVAAATLAVILAGSLYRTLTLRRGGETVARLLGGRPLDPGTRDPAERRLLNVVEEMAIASGIAVPPVYVLDGEEGINAFAAGFEPGDAVLGFTRGCVQGLSRDELQGVAGHEFSHVLNGDMRLNLRLIGLLHGILVIALIGYWLLRSLRFSSAGRRKGGGGVALGLLLFGLALVVLGYAGVFFGRLIKSAVSRQREFLADAAAVQFTRYPPGLAAALRKIGGLAAGSRLRTPNAEQASHLYFADGLAPAFARLLSTHPPLAERVRRLDPSFDGSFPPPLEAAPSDEGGEEVASRLSPPAVRAETAAAGVDPARLLGTVGTFGREHVAWAAALLSKLPAPLLARTREPAEARAVVFALLLHRTDARRSQLEGLGRREGRWVVEQVLAVEKLLASCPPAARLPLVELSIPALSGMSPAQYRRFCAAVRELATADREESLFELALRKVLVRHLGSRFEERPARTARPAGLASSAGDVALLLASLARHGHADERQATRAFAAGVAILGTEPAPRMPSREEADLRRVDASLDRLAHAAPAVQRAVVAAAAATVALDGRLTPEEGELLRALCDSLGCPMPPFAHLAPASSNSAAPFVGKIGTS